MIAVRGTTADFMQPYVFTTSEGIEDYFFLQFKETMSDFALKLEAYHLQGASGMYAMSIL